MQYVNGRHFEANYARLYIPRMSIGDRLDKAMKAADIESQSALARKSGVPQATISRILKGSGKKGPETETIKRLAAACGVSFDYLIEDTDEAGPLIVTKQPAAANDEHVTVEEIIELITAYKNATSKDRKWIMNSAKIAAERSDKGNGSAAN